MPDARFQDTLVTHFVNELMESGKKSLAFRVFYGAMDRLSENAEKEGIGVLELWKEALNNVTPGVEVKSRRIGGATFQVPTEIRPERRSSISMKSIIKYARQRSGKSMSEKLAAEIWAAYKSEGGAFKKKEDTHKMAEANRAFAHYRF